MYVVIKANGTEIVPSNAIVVVKCFYCMCLTAEEDYSYHQSICNPKQESV